MDFINGNQNIYGRQLSVNEQGNITWISYNESEYVFHESNLLSRHALFVSEIYKLTSDDDSIQFIFFD